MQDKLSEQKNNTNVRYNSLKTRLVYGSLSLTWLLSAGRTSRFLEKQFFAPNRYTPSAKEKEVLQAGRLFRLQIHGKTVNAWRWGTGTGILFVHGWNGRGGQFHRFIPKVVERGFCAIAFDAPAHGTSEGRTTNGFEFYDTVKALLAPSRGLAVHGLVGHSLGAAAVVYAQSSYPVHTRSVLLAPALKLAAILERGFIERGIPPAVHKGILRMLEQQYGYDLKIDDPHLLVPKLFSETLVVHDRRDTTIPYADSRYIVEDNPHIRLKTTEGLGHNRLLYDAHVEKSVLKHLFQKIPPAPAEARLPSPASPQHQLAEPPKALSVA